MQIKAYKFRLYPSALQQKQIIKQFVVCKEVHNIVLEQSLNAQVFNRRDLYTIVKDIKTTCPSYYYLVHSQALQNVADRLSKSFASTFRRAKERANGAKVKLGFPRFKSHIRSMTYPQSGFRFVNERKISISKLGNIPIVLHRIPKGTMKTLTIKRNAAGQWFATFCCELPEKHLAPLSPLDEAIGLDVGINKFAALSNTEIIQNPRYLMKSEQKLIRLQRNLSRKKKGSKNRLKARFHLALQHLKIRNQRYDFLHQTSTKLIRRYRHIVVEDLRIKNLVKHPNLAKHIHDASWGNFVRMLSYKAVAGGGFLEQVDPRYTSSTCCNCLARNKMPLNKRVLTCHVCDFVCDRDVNAAVNIFNRRAGRARTHTPADRVTSASSPKLVSELNEPGTIVGNTTLSS